MFSNKALLTLLAIVLVALVSSGCSSSSSSSSPAEVDTAPPAVPTGLGAGYVDGIVKVGWDANLLDADFAGFVVARFANGATVELMDTPANITTFVDQNPIAGITEYWVAGVDQTGNQSAYATTLVEIRPQYPAPRDGS